MKKILYYTALMVLIVILLPAIIVRGCGPAPPQKPPAPRDPGKSVRNHGLQQGYEADRSDGPGRIHKGSGGGRNAGRF